MLSLPLVSVIIPLYNAEKYVAEAIESVINQTYTHWELIIVNDGSTDNSLAVAKKYANEKIKVYSQENKGQCSASNYGFSKSNGDFIKFLDADDIFNKNLLQVCIDNFNENNEMIFIGIQYFKNTQNLNLEFENKLLSQHIEFYEPMQFLLSNDSNMMQGGRWFIPREIIKKGGLWYENLSVINDFEYFTRLVLCCNKIKYVRTKLFYYRDTPNSLSSHVHEKAIKSIFSSLYLGTKYMIKYENSIQTRAYSARMFRDFSHKFYPEYPKYVNLSELKVKKLGGTDFKYDHKNFTGKLSKIFGWKFAKQLSLLKNKLF
jgi:glycosyltransferase involved in cell wall biosynthesis